MSEKSPVEQKVDRALTDLRTLLRNAFYDDLEKELKRIDTTIGGLAEQLAIVARRVSRLDPKPDDYSRSEIITEPGGVTLNEQQAEILCRLVEEAVQRALRPEQEQNVPVQAPADTVPEPAASEHMIQGLQAENALLPLEHSVVAPTTYDARSDLVKLRQYVIISIIVTILGWLLPAFTFWHAWR